MSEAKTQTINAETNCRRYVERRYEVEAAEKVDNLIKRIIDFTNKAGEEERTKEREKLMTWIRCDLIQISAYWREGFENQKIKSFMMCYFGKNEQTALEMLRKLSQ